MIVFNIVIDKLSLVTLNIKLYFVEESRLKSFRLQMNFGDWSFIITFDDVLSDFHFRKRAIMFTVIII